jgi:hypothetical protein
MTGQDALLHEANRCAHELAKAAARWEEWNEKNPREIPFVPPEIAREYYTKVKAYREADRRAQMEASL